MAREQGVSGWHSMRKEELIRALLRAARRRGKSPHVSPRSPRGRTSSASKGRTNGKANGRLKRQTSPEAQRKLTQMHSHLARVKDLTSQQADERPGASEDRLVVMVRDPYWLHAYWEFTRRTVDRAKAAMAQRWHGAHPVLRLYRLDNDGSAKLQKDIAIHGGVRHWYVDVAEPPATYRLEIGYLAEDGAFYCLARSGDVSTPPAGSSDAVDKNWADVAENADRIFAMSGGYSEQGANRELQELLEERLRRPLGSPMKTRFGAGASRMADGDPLQFAVDAELVVYGVASRDSHVTLKGEPVPLRSDGTFAVRMPQPDCRQVIPIVASSYDGVEQRTIILAVERNTKTMEPVVRDATER